MLKAYREDHKILQMTLTFVNHEKLSIDFTGP